MSLRHALGALVYDVPRTLWGLRPALGRALTRAPWLAIRNRRERLIFDPAGVACDWRWTSDLHVARVFPALGLRLMRRALRDWPLAFADAPPLAHGDGVDVSFVVGQRGVERLPLLLATLRTLAAQTGARVECVVVEQSPRAEIAAALPAWVRHVHTPPPAGETRYSRAWAFNVGARAARAELLVFHDGDILVPRGYARALLDARAAGAEVIDLKRFLFELTEAQNTAALSERLDRLRGALERIRQNAHGGTLAVTRTAFFELGGFDESFVGWGGEDNEFWERAALRRVHPWGCLPFVHLWHAAQPGKDAPGGAPTLSHYERLSASAPRERVARLCARGFGQRDGPRA